MADVADSMPLVSIDDSGKNIYELLLVLSIPAGDMYIRKISCFYPFLQKYHSKLNKFFA